VTVARDGPQQAAPDKQGRPRAEALTVQGWSRLVFAVITFLVLVTAATTAVLLAQERTVTDHLEGAVLPAQAQAYRLQGALVDQETGVRGYGITGDTRFLQPYTSGRAIEADAAGRLHRLIGSGPALAANLASVERAADQWRASYADPLIALARRGPLTTRDAGLLDGSKRAFDQLRVLFARQNAGLAADMARARQSLRHVRAIQAGVFTAVLAVLLLAPAALTLALQHAVVRPLSRLRTASRRVVDGDFGHHIESAGPADVRAVASDVEGMRSSLVEALRAARAAQEVAVKQAADLDTQATELRRSNAELEQFAYVASHDLQEPLRKIASFCQLLEKRYGAGLDERGRQYIGFAVDGAKRMQNLINDLLAFSRVGRTHDARIRVSMDEALDTAIMALGSAIDESGAVVKRPRELPDVVGDPSLLAVLWQNLVGNAIKFRTPGRDPCVRITVAAAHGNWRFCVTDNGIGIAPEYADTVFVIFRRLHGRDSYPGTGIGLAICKRIVEHHGGDIVLDTTYTGGARMCFTLPAVPPAERDQASEDVTASAEGIPA